MTAAVAPAMTACQAPWLTLRFAQAFKIHGTYIARVHSRLKTILFLLLTITAPAALADSGVWGERGIAQSFASRAPYLFEANGLGIAVYDAASNDPRRTAIVPTRAESLGVAISDDLYSVTREELARYAIGADGSLTLRASIPTSDYTTIAAGEGLVATLGPSRLTVWDTSNEMPVAIGEIPVTDPVNAIAFHGSQLWVSVEGRGISGYDANQSLQPVITLPVNGRAMAVRGDLLYIAAGVNGLVIASVNDVSSAQIISRTDAGVVNLLRIAVAANRAYAAEDADTIQVYDVTSAEAPQRIAAIHDYAQVLGSDGARLFAAGSELDKFGLAHVTPVRFSIYQDATRLGGFSEALAGPVSGVATDGTFAYVIDWPWFRVLDISTPSKTKEVASISFPAMQDHVKIRDGLAIVYGRAQVNLVDIHDPWRPRLLGTWDSLGAAGGGATFLGDSIIEANPQDGFHVLDFFKSTSPDKPLLIGSIVFHYYELTSYQTTAYAFDLVEFRVADVSDPRHPRTVRELAAAHGPATVAVNDNGPAHLVVESPTRFHVFDLSDPGNPVEVGSAAAPLVPGVVAAESGASVLIARVGGVDKLDISVPNRPRLVTSTMSAVAPMQIAAANGKVVIADRYCLRVYGEVSAAPVRPPARVRPSR